MAPGKGEPIKKASVDNSKPETKSDRAHATYDHSHTRADSVPKGEKPTSKKEK